MLNSARDLSDMRRNRDSWRDKHKTVTTERDILRTEVERLRTALQSIADIDAINSEFTRFDYLDTHLPCVFEMQRIAKAALGAEAKIEEHPESLYDALRSDDFNADS